MQVVTVSSKLRDYTVAFADDATFLGGIGGGRARVTVCDRRVWDLYAETLAPLADGGPLVMLDAVEDRKNLRGVETLYDAFIAHKVRRNWTLVSVGGGITQDLTGFVASTLYRGMAWTYIPTTLLAQADSCIGSKTSLNYNDYKNLIGTFYPPSDVYIYPEFLRTLSRPDYFSGLGEVVKLHLMGGEATAREYLGALAGISARDLGVMRGVIERALEVKRAYFEGDEFDTGRRRLLNFGHCLGHAVESVSNFEIPHGQAVVVGMIFACLVARARGHLSAASFDFVYEALLKPTLAVTLRAEHLEADAIVRAMSLDKKREGAGLPLILMGDGMQMSQTQDLRPDEVVEGLRVMSTLLSVPPIRR